MKIPPSTLLAILIAFASVLGAIIHSQKNKKLTSSSPELIEKISQLEKQIEILTGENETLKKIQVNGAEITLPIEHYKFVENTLSLTFPKHVPARRVDDETLAKAVSFRFTEQFGYEGMEMRKFAFEILNIMPVNQHLINQLTIAETSGAVAYYDPTANEILLSASFDDENLLHITSVIKHLSIALLELNLPLTEEQRLNLTDDAYHAREAFIKGIASSVSQRFRNVSALEAGQNRQVKPNLETQEIFNSLPILIRGLSTFPAIHGKTYIEEIMLQNNLTFPELYKNIPGSTATIFAKTVPKTEPAKAIIPLEENQHLSTQLGQLFIMLYLEQLDNPPSDLHKKLTSDQLTITNDLRDYTTAWVTNWESEQDAQAFYTLATELSSIPEIKPKVTISDKQVIIKITIIHNF